MKLGLLGAATTQYAADDIVASVTWSSTRSHMYVDVVKCDTYAFSKVLARQLESLPDDLTHVILMYGHGLVTGLCIDKFVLQCTGGESQDRPDIGCCGVVRVGGFRGLYERNAAVLQAAGLSHVGWESHPPVLADEFMVVATPLLRKLSEFVPRVIGAGWRGPVGALVPWVSVLSGASVLGWGVTREQLPPWVSVLSGLSVLGWGTTRKQLPPLYIGDREMPPPHVLVSEFSVFGDVREIQGYGEDDVREMYKRRRGETCRELPAYGPLLYAQPSG